MTNADRRLAAIATGQLAAFSRRQAHDAGVSDRQLRRRVQSGILITVRSERFPQLDESDHTAGRTPRPRSSTSANRCWTTGPTSAALLGFDGYALRRPFHLLVPRHRHLSRASRPPAPHRSDGPDRPVRDRRSSPSRVPSARSSNSLACSAPMSWRCASTAPSATGSCRRSCVHRRIAALRSSGRHGLPALLDVLVGNETTRGGQSWLEREYLTAARRRRPASSRHPGRADPGGRPARSRGLPLPADSGGGRVARLSIPPNQVADHERCRADQRPPSPMATSRTSSPTTRSPHRPPRSSPPLAGALELA